jgi:uncharacterized membrane protein
MLWEHTAVIDAPADVVWRLTTDVARWPSFMPTVQRVERLDSGPLRLGSAARLKQPGQLPAVWTVTRLEPMRAFVWQTRRMGMTMTGSHVLEPAGSGCRNTLAVELTGRGSGPLGALIAPMIRKVLRDENAAFQRAARSQGAMQN